MFVIVHDNTVIKGPNEWNKRRFEEVLREECEIEYTLDSRNDTNRPIIISDSIQILPVIGMPLPDHNPRLHNLHGPFWNFTSTGAEMSFEPIDYGLDTVKGNLKDAVTNYRYTKETRGIKLTVQNTEVTIDTARGSRDIFLQAYLTLSDTETLNWKFPETWILLSKTDLGNIVNSGRNHIQDCFNWELDFHAKVDAKTSLDELNDLWNEFDLYVQSENPTPQGIL